MADGDIRVESGASFRCPPDRLWPVLADTDRLNRAAGLDRVELSPAALPSAARVVGRTRIAGMDVGYEELPFEWELHRRYSVERRYTGGPVSRVILALDVEPEGAGSRVRMVLTLAPRWPDTGPILMMQGTATIAALLAAVGEGDAALADGRPPPVGSVTLEEAALTRAVALLREALPARDTGIADRLATWLQCTDDAEVARIRPYALADTWSLERRDVLGACLLAVRAGLLELRWELVCPSCQQPASSAPALADVADHGECGMCEIQWETRLERAVEATFKPAPAVRALVVGRWCTGGPAKTPHVLAQKVVPAHGAARLPVPAGGALRLFVRGGASFPVTIDASAPANAVAGDGPIRVAPGGHVEVRNDGDDARHAKLERLTWTDQAATAADVIALPGFRRDFSLECLAPGVALKVGRVALLFSDLTDSTRLYSEIGDAAAWRLVQDHFTVVNERIGAHGGVVVKTIGDAVMAAFADESQAVRAGIDVLAAFEAFRAGDLTRGRVRIKLGVYAGPCYAVTLNDRLDYFGQTVNIAARLQGAASGGELVVPAELLDRLMDLPPHERCGTFEPELKGVDVRIPAIRIRHRA